jgi:hypothetical protein
MITLDMTSGVTGTYSFRLNSPFDPNYTASGHQPMGFDQWAAFYNHYVVESCAWEVVPLSPAAASIPIHLMFYLSDDITLPTDMWTYVELGSEYQPLVSNVKPATMSGHVDVNKFFNRSSIGADSELRALVTANPTEVVFGTVVARPMDSSSTVSIYCTVRLTMKVKFMEPKDLTPSFLKSPPIPVPDATSQPDMETDSNYVDYEMLYKQAYGSQTPSEHGFNFRKF